MMYVYYSSFSLIRITNGSKKLISLIWFWVLCLHVIDSAPLHLFPGGCGGLRSPASAWLVPWPAPAHACNAVCNEKSKQGTAVRHDRNVFPLEGAPCKKKKEEKKNKKKRWGRVVSRRSAHLGQSGRLMLLYIGRHSASPPSPIGSWSLYQFLLCLSRSLSLFFPRLCLLRWTVTQFWMIPPSARMAVDCVIESESWGACRELEVEAPTRVHSGWEGVQEVEGQTPGGTKQKMERKRKEVKRVSRRNRGRANKGREEVWGAKKKKKKGGKERQRMSKSEMEKKKSTTHFENYREGWLSSVEAVLVYGPWRMSWNSPV